MKGEIGVWKETTEEKKIRWRGMSGGQQEGRRREQSGGLRKRQWEHCAHRENDQGRKKRHRRGDSLSFIQIFWEHGLSPAGSFV